jgi:hypothetical protein
MRSKVGTLSSGFVMKRFSESRLDLYEDGQTGCRANGRERIHRPARVLCLANIWLVAAVMFLAFASQPVLPQQTVVQTPSPMVDSTRPHPRIAQTEVPGRRIELQSLKGSRLFAGPRVNTKKAVPLIIHFHGAAWLVESHVAKNVPNAALITVNLGSGSSSYGRPFEKSEVFQALIDEASQVLGLKRGWSSITLSGFSAGYGAVRAILRQDKNFELVNNVLLLDGMHASYSPESKLLADGGSVNAADLDSFVKFAREASAGRKTFIFTHSEIFPGTYASTTECADYLLAAIGLRSYPRLKQGPIGMQQLSEVKKGGFIVFGYAGNTAPDHVDHLQAMSAWLKMFRFK